jgi:uncharacterized integral membrane protein
MAKDPNAEGSPPASKRDARDIARLVVFGLALVLLIAFIIANSASVRVHFVFFDTRASLIWVILVSAMLGVLVDRLVILLRKRRAAKSKS